MHVFTQCRGMEGIWNSQPFNLPAIDPQGSMWAFFHSLRFSLDEDDFLLALVVCWKSWEIRNKDVHHSPYDIPPDIVLWCKNDLADYRSAQCVPFLSPRQPPSLLWQPPGVGQIKINVDAAFPRNSRNFRVSMVARDHDGRCLWWSRREFCGRPQPMEGEAWAVLHGLREGRDRGWNSVVIESDCANVIHHLTRRTHSLAPFGAILDSCYLLFLCFFRCYHFHMLGV